jgi:hypothetical protein
LSIIPENNYKKIEYIAFSFLYAYNEMKAYNAMRNISSNGYVAEETFSDSIPPLKNKQTQNKVKPMKKMIMLEIIINLILILLMFFPLYCFCIAPLLLIVANIYFDYKHRNKFVLWRLALIDLIFLIVYKFDIYIVDINNTMSVTDYVSHLILFIPFIIAILLSCVTYLIYQLIVLLNGKRKTDDGEKPLEM